MEPRALAEILVCLVLGSLAVLAWWRKSHGLSWGRTVAADSVEYRSERLRLCGRPDRLVKYGKHLIPEEIKSSRQVSHGHVLQLGTYFLLMEDDSGVRPPYGFVVLKKKKGWFGRATRVKVKNTEALRSEVLDIAERIRQSRRDIYAEIPVRQPDWKCRACSQRENCRQARR